MYVSEATVNAAAVPLNMTPVAPVRLLPKKPGFFLPDPPGFPPVKTSAALSFAGRSLSFGFQDSQ
jgi:hypothetical protein